MTDEKPEKSNEHETFFGPIIMSAIMSAVVIIVYLIIVTYQFADFQSSCISHGYCHHDPISGRLVWQDGKEAP